MAENPLAADGDDPAESLCDSVAAFLRDAARGFSFQAEVLTPDDPYQELFAEKSDFRLVAYPVEASEERIGVGSGKARVEYAIQVAAVGPLDEQHTRRDYARWVYEVTKALRGAPMPMGKRPDGADHQEATHQRTRRVTQFDPDEMRRELYLTAIDAVYQHTD